MVQRRKRERSLFEVLLPDGHKLWPDWLRKIDALLEDDAVIEVVGKALEARWPQSRRRGRPGTLAEVVIRMLILKHLFDWSYDDLERRCAPIWSIGCLPGSMPAMFPTPRPSWRSRGRSVRRSLSSCIGKSSRSPSVPGSRTAVDFASTPRS